MFSDDDWLGGRWIPGLVSGFGVLLAGFAFLVQGQFNLLLSGMAATALLACLRLNVRLAICITFVFLFGLGDLRRISGSLIGFPTLDALLLVGPAFTICLVIPIFLRNINLGSRISKLVLALMAVMFLEVFNPSQGGITVGLAGVMVLLIPVSWFWIGREHGSLECVSALIYRIVIPVGVVAAALGLYQSFVGFLPWEQIWIDKVRSTYTALNVGYGFVRSFGFSVNAIEYADLLVISSAFCMAAVFAGKRFYLLPLPLLLPALFLASSRQPLIKLVVAVAATWAVSKAGHGWLLRFPIALGLIVVIGTFVLGSAFRGGEGVSKSAVDSSIQHQVNGLVHPTDSRYSTAGLHSTMFLGGIMEGLKAPLGRGLGSTTLAGGKFTDSASGSTEIDISDAFVSMGVFGGVIYVWLIFALLQLSLRSTQSGNSQIVLPIFAVLISMLGAWIALGQYAVSPLIWFLIGVLERSEWQPRPRKATSHRGTPFADSIEPLLVAGGKSFP